MRNATNNFPENNVLVVDDDDEFRLALVHYLQTNGFAVLETNSSTEACWWISEGKVTVVLLDWDLRKAKSRPEHPPTGLEILRACRNTNPLLPVIVMSGARDLDSRGDSIMEDADCFLAKPFALRLLSEHLRRWVMRVQVEQNPFTQIASGNIQPAEAVNRAYARAVVKKIGSALQAAPKLGLSRQTVASYLSAANPSSNPKSSLVKMKKST